MFVMSFFSSFKFKWLLAGSGESGQEEAKLIWRVLFGERDVVWAKWHELKTSKWGFESANRHGPADDKLRDKIKGLHPLYLDGPSGGSTCILSLLAGAALRGGEKIGEITPGWWDDQFWFDAPESAQDASA
jgi:hypothetical protein